MSTLATSDYVVLFTKCSHNVTENVLNFVLYLKADYHDV